MRVEEGETDVKRQRTAVTFGALVICSRRPAGDARPSYPPLRRFGVAGNEVATFFLRPSLAAASQLGVNQAGSVTIFARSMCSLLEKTMRINNGLF